MVIVPVALAGRSYDVRIGTGLLYDLANHVRPFLRKKHVCIVVDGNVKRIWGETVVRSLENAGIQARWFTVEPGESAKSWDTLIELIDWLLENNIERGDHVLALGGGVVGDLTGFACSILKRGCGFVQLPTTLLAQVDSSVGGKTAINTRAGKNLVGSFHQPSLVLADLDTLSTLPSRELRAGYAEVLKYGVLGDAEFFQWLEDHAYSVLALQRQTVEQAVTSAVSAKARIVAEDERETSGARALLNLGHTFGHALEAATGFSDRLLHGEAVGLGMVLAARYSARQDSLGDADAERITRAIDAAGLPAEISALDLNTDGSHLTAHMLHDKKMDAGELPFVLLRGIGGAYLEKRVHLTDVSAFLDEQLRAH